MRAWQVLEKGTGRLRIDLVDLPDPSDGLIVDVHAAGIGFPDLLMSRGEFQIRQPTPFTLGWEAAGVVVDAGASQFRPGDRVATISFGAFADRLSAVPESTFPLPAGLDFPHGAALPLNYLTALAALEYRGHLVAGERLLVHGAGGGVGSAAVQIGKALGAHVTAVVSDADKACVARAAGADRTVSLSDDWRQCVMEGSVSGVDMVFDPVGGERFVDSLRCLAPQGRLMVVGFAAGQVPNMPVHRLLHRNIDVRGCTWSILTTAPGGVAGAARRLADMVTAGQVDPQIGAIYPFDELPAALDTLSHRKAQGKLILTTR
ncbi:NADPH:quinone oxidoreductase family protein [Streptomyces chryseus]